MTNPVAIPTDIIDHIIEAVGYDPPLLKKCALVSSSFLLLSRKHLFSYISLRSPRGCERLHQFLTENPVVQSFVRSISVKLGLRYQTSEPHSQSNYTSLIAILRLPFCCLERFSINYCAFMHRPSNWNDFSSELRDAFSTIIHLSTLKALHLEQLVNMPIVVFRGIHFTKLVLSALSPNDFDNEGSRLTTPAALEGVKASHMVIDQCEWRICLQADGMRFPTSVDISLIWDMEGPTEPIFLPFMGCLRVFEIYIGYGSDLDTLSLLMRSLRVSLTSPATLEHLKITIEFEGNDNHFNYYALFDELRDADVWHHLDSMIAHPIGSLLQRVDIHIPYCFGYDDDGQEPHDTEVMEPVLDALPLLREKGILFVEATLTA